MFDLINHAPDKGTVLFSSGENRDGSPVAASPVLARIVPCMLLLSIATLVVGGEARSATEYAAAEKRLAKTYSFDRVAKEHIEVRWDDLRGMATPLARRVPIQACHHPQVVFIHPDLSLTIGCTARDPSAFGIGFALGKPAQLPNMWKVSRRLHGDYMPIVESQWQIGPITIIQTALAILPTGREVITGTETQYVVVRLAVGNSSDAACQTPLYVMVGAASRDKDACGYGPFLTPIGRWQTPSRQMTLRNSALTTDGKTLLTYRCSAPTEVSYARQLAGVTETAGHSDALTNVLRFNLDLKPGQRRTIDLVVAGASSLYPQTEQAAMAKIDFDVALRQATAHWESQLTPSMKYVTPEPQLNRVYQQLILSTLQNAWQVPGSPWHEPVQSPDGAVGVWCWENAHASTPLMALGYCQELRPGLRYLIDHQNGGGKNSLNSDVKSNRGSFGGTAIAWLNDTGSVLWTLAEEYRYSRDAQWLAANRPSIVAAWDWIQTARAQTRIMTKDGTKAPQYGLLPAGQECDYARGYCFAFSDAFTWLGMSEMAKAFRQASLPEAERMARDVEDYRQCLADVIRREQGVHPETKLSIVSNAVSQRLEATWHGDGPIHLFDVGLLKPADERFEPMFEHTRRKYGVLMGLTTHESGGNQWYPSQTERSYYRCFLGRGEIERSLLVFYSNLAYGRASDTYQTCERFLANDPNHSPFEPNASGNGRQLDMMRRMLIDEQDEADGVLWLLRGCPRRWFAKGASIEARRAPTLFGEMSLVSHSNGDTITVDVNAPAWEKPKEIRLVIRHPDRKTMANVTVNGKPIAAQGETVILPSASGHLRIVASYE
jgi:hypothetical protein